VVVIVSKGTNLAARATAIRIRSFAFSVACFQP